MAHVVESSLVKDDNVNHIDDDELDDIEEIDIWKFLNVPANAPISEIKRSYRELALRYHPDKTPQHASEKFALLTYCYDEALRRKKRPTARNKFVMALTTLGWGFVRAVGILTFESLYGAKETLLGMKEIAFKVMTPVLALQWDQSSTYLANTPLQVNEEYFEAQETRDEAARERELFDEPQPTLGEHLKFNGLQIVMGALRPIRGLGSAVGFLWGAAISSSSNVLEGISIMWNNESNNAT